MTRAEEDRLAAAQDLGFSPQDVHKVLRDPDTRGPFRIFEVFQRGVEHHVFSISKGLVGSWEVSLCSFFYRTRTNSLGLFDSRYSWIAIFRSLGDNNVSDLPYFEILARCGASWHVNERAKRDHVKEITDNQLLSPDWLTDSHRTKEGGEHVTLRPGFGLSSGLSLYAEEEEQERVAKLVSPELYSLFSNVPWCAEGLLDRIAVWRWRDTGTKWRPDTKVPSAAELPQYLQQCQTIAEAIRDSRIRSTRRK